MAIGQKRKRNNTTDDTTDTVKPPLKKAVPRASLDANRDILTMRAATKKEGEEGDMTTTTQQPFLLLQRIAASNRTPFEKRVLSALCQIPPGRVSTYGLLSAHLGSSPRAVGGALRRNPLAPEVPCHRVVATGGGLGGFKGHWATTSTTTSSSRSNAAKKKKKQDGEEEKDKPGDGGGSGKIITLEEKKRLLRAEGVCIDEIKERVLGSPWSGFV